MNNIKKTGCFQVIHFLFVTIYMKNLTFLLRVFTPYSTLWCLLFIVGGAVSGLTAQNTIRVSDPRNSWYNSGGTIEEATVSVTPQGAYWEVGLYLTFSARGSQWDKPI